MTPEQVAARLVDDGFAMRKPCQQTRCWTTIELKALCGPIAENYYVTRAGEIRRGATLKASAAVPPSFARKFTGD